MKRILERSNLLEGLLLFPVLILLTSVARPLADTAFILGRGKRYLRLQEFSTSSWSRWPLDPIELAQHMGTAITVIALAGWLVLLLSRQRLPTLAKFVMGLVAWSTAMAVMLRISHPQFIRADTPDDPARNTMIWMLIACVGILAVPLVARFKESPWPERQQVTRPWLFPTWVLLTGIGQIWLTDISARGHEKYLLLAVQQFQTLILASMVLTLGAVLKPALVPRLGRALARLDTSAVPHSPTPIKLLRNAQPWALYAVYGAWVLMVLITVGLATEKTGVRAELIRLPAIALLGWLTYRWVDAINVPPHTRMRGYLAIVLTALFTLLPLAISGDNGQVLLLMLVGTVMAASLVGAALSRTKMSGAVGILAFAVLAAAVMHLIYHYGSAYSSTLKWRIEALTNDFYGRKDFLSVLRWFMANTPAWGYGLGRVPWCGTLGSLSPTECVGIAKQAQSDYVFSLLVGIWGEVAAWSITALTALWFCGLVRPSTLSSSRKAIDTDAHRMTAWMVLVFSAVSLVQLFITCFGVLGAMPLTGVPYPLLGYGRASLLVCALYASLAINTPRRPSDCVHSLA